MTPKARPIAGGGSRSAPGLALGAAALALLLAPILRGSGPEAPVAIAREMRDFGVTGTVLYVAAHPDDENTMLLTYLARGRGYRTAYLSLTRGDGGQNLLGPEFGDLLGVIRTQELLAARQLDGGRQFFSRAKDFGYSKDYRQTLTKWDHQQVLSDIVRVIRTFRPDVVITRFPPEPGGTHGHHTASAYLAVEAFGMAGDPKAFPEQLATLAPWQPRRIVWNGWWGPGRAAPDGASPEMLHLAIDGEDPVTGASFAVLAAKSRSMHRTQGFANFSVASAGSGPHTEAFKVLAGEPARVDIMDGVDTTWARVPGGAEIGVLAAEAGRRFNPNDPAGSVPALLEIKAKLARLPADPLVEEKRGRLDHLLASCLGLAAESSVSEPEIVPGESFALHHTAVVSSTVPVEWVAIRYPTLGRKAKGPGLLSPGVAATVDARRGLPDSTPLTEPYWLREPGSAGMFRVDDPALIGRPEGPAPIPVEDVFVVGGQTLVVPHDAVFVRSVDGRADARLLPRVIPPVTLGMGSPVVLFAPGAARAVTVTVTASRPGQSGTVGLVAPDGWGASPTAQPFLLKGAGDRREFTFQVTAPRSPSSCEIRAVAVVGGVRYGTDRIDITYGHIAPQLLQPPARFKAVCLDLAIRGKRVGYLPGAGDSTAASLREMGYEVVPLADKDLSPEGLKGLDAVVIGVRAFNTRTDLPSHLRGLFDYAESGGTVVEQYNTPGGLQTDQLAPFALKLNRDLPRYRVTDEKGAVTLLLPAHPALNEPNRIVEADFGGWVQERGLDFASDFDTAHFDALISCSDPGEPPLKGGLLVARVGRGYFVYTGLSFFRQLPAGVPGAYRLFANLVSLGK